jgi:hypothetical protein
MLAGLEARTDGGRRPQGGVMTRWKSAVAWTLVSTLAAPLAAEPPGAATPQALVARMQAAAGKNDIGELMSCLAPDDRREMAVGLVAGATMMVAFMGMAGEMGGDMAEGMAEGVSGESLSAEEKAKLEKGKKEVADKAAAMQKKLEGVLKKHGVDKMMEDSTPLPAEGAERSKALAAMFEGTDEIAMSKDLIALLEEVGKAEGKEEKPQAPMEVPKEVTDYKVAGDTATAKSGDETVDFVRVDGRWYFKAPAKDREGLPGL